MKKAFALLVLGILAVSVAAAAAQAVQDKTPAAPAQASPAPVEPVKGHLVIIGGGGHIDLSLKRFIDLAERFQSGRIIVYMMADSTPMEDWPATLEDFKRLGAKSVTWANLTHEQALVQDNADALNDIGGIYFEGGDQARLTASLLDTPIHAKIMELYRKGAVIGGTSAGAAVMSEVMITGDEKRKPGGEEVECEKFRTIEAGNIITTRGFGLVTSAVIDQHHIYRKRTNRVISVIAEHPDLLGVAIDEDTCIQVEPDQTFEVVGEKCVLVLDPGRAKVKTLASKLLNIESMTLHLLTPGTRYDLKNRVVIH